MSDIDFKLQTRKTLAVVLVITVAIVATNMWIIGLMADPESGVVSPGGFMEFWVWINPLYDALAAFCLARLFSEPCDNKNKLLRIGFSFVILGSILNLAVLGGVMWFWHIVDGVLVICFLTRAVDEWKGAS